LIAEHADKSLDELVSLRIINADQKAQAQAKPDLEDKLQQLQKQLEVLEQIEREHRALLAAQEKSLTEKFEADKAELVAELEEKAASESAKSLSDNLLVLSQFLRLAAARRAEDIDTTADENVALEGVLLHVYSGDESAVSTMLKLVHGADDPTLSTSNEVLQTTCMCLDPKQKSTR
jgi:hypothetical protein